MFTIILAVLLGIAIITIGILYVNLQAEKNVSQYFADETAELYEKNYDLQRKLAKRKERHLRASGHITRQQAQLEEKDRALVRTNQIIELFLETFHGFEGDVKLTRNQARRLFVV